MDPVEPVELPTFELRVERPRPASLPPRRRREERSQQDQSERQRDKEQGADGREERPSLDVRA